MPNSIENFSEGFTSPYPPSSPLNSAFCPSIHFLCIIFTGRSMAKIKSDVAEKGDIGTVAEVSIHVELTIMI